VTGLADLLAQDPVARWFVATVFSFDAGTKNLTLSYNGGTLPNIDYLTSYAPVAGDRVHVLADDRNGMLVIGADVIRTLPTIPAPGAVVTVPLLTGNSWQIITDARLGVSHWIGSPVQQSPSLRGALFYTAALLAPLAGVDLSRFEIQLTLAAGSGPLSLILHDNLDVTTPFTASAFMPLQVYLRDVPVGVSSWVELPLAWAGALAAGTAKGIGLYSDIYTATVSAGGTLRFTPL
jgi:hypothetical protein